MKKAISFLLFFCIVFSMTFTVHADEKTSFFAMSETIEQKNYDSTSESSNSSSSVNSYFPIFSSSQVSAVKSDMLNAIQNQTAQINVANYNLKANVYGIKKANGQGYYDLNETTNTLELNSKKQGQYNLMLNSPDLDSIYNEIRLGNEFAFNVINYTYSYNLPWQIESNFPNTALSINTIYFYYRMTDEEYQSAKAFLYDTIDSIVKKIDGNFTDLEKIVYVHDFFVEKYEYKSEPDNFGGNMYNFFSNNGGVCLSYALAYKGILNRLGIENTVAIHDGDGTTSGHIWNIVKLEDSYYHVDCTHDDPLFDNNKNVLGYVNHRFCLLSDTAINGTTSHTDWYTLPLDEKTVSCKNNKYDNADWKNAIGKLSYCNNAWYSITSSLPTKIISYSRRTLEGAKTVNTFSAGYGGGISPRGVAQLGTMLYFSDVKKVVEYDVLNDSFRTILTIDNLKSVFDMGEGKIGYLLDDYSLNINYTIDLKMGDLNRDGNITSNDVADTINIILGNNSLNRNTYFVDLNYDGGIDLIDLVMLKRMVVDQ